MSTSDIPFPLPVIGFAAYSGTGKTSLLKQLIPLLCTRGLRVGLIKQSHHDIELDEAGKDSYELRKAGAMQTLLATPQRRFLIQEQLASMDTELQDCLTLLDCSTLDLVLVEGFKHAAFDKIELHRKALHKPLLYRTDNHIIAFATDQHTDEHPLPVLDLNDAETMCDYICEYYSLSRKTTD